MRAAANLGITSAAPAASAAARAPTASAPPGDSMSIDDSAPSQAPVFLDLNGDGEVSSSLYDPTPDLTSAEPSLLDNPILDAATAPLPVDPFSTQTDLEKQAEVPVDTPTPAIPSTAPPRLLPEDGEAANLKPVVIIGPSGVGKGTLIARFMDRHGAHFGFTVSHTTRQPRPGEQDGKEYHFVTREAMQKAVSEGQFLEHAEVHGNLYGTSIAAVRAVSSEGKTAILEIDVQVHQLFS
jgi:hypothetical protein